MRTNLRGWTEHYCSESPQENLIFGYIDMEMSHRHIDIKDVIPGSRHYYFCPALCHPNFDPSIMNHMLQNAGNGDKSAKTWSEEGTFCNCRAHSCSKSIIRIL